MRKKALSWLLAVSMVVSLFVTLPITALADVDYAGNAAVFYSGSNSYITVPDSASLDVTNAVTVEAWIKPSSGGGEWAQIVCKQLNSTDNPPYATFRLYAASETGFPGTIRFAITPDGNSSSILLDSSTVVPNDEWTHVAGVYDGAEMRIYINGELKGSTPASGLIETSDLPLYIGKSPWTDYNNYNGMMDEVRVWNVARTAEQISSDMQHVLTGSEPGLVSYWNFNEALGQTTIADASGNGNTGTLYVASLAVSDVPVTAPATYTVSLGALSGGGITAAPTSAGEGTTINLTITPDSGKQLKAGTLKYNDGTSDNAISGTNFTMPAANVTVTAEFEDAPLVGLTEDFETGLDGWAVADISGTAGDWTLSTTQAHSGTNSARFNSWSASIGSSARLYQSADLSLPSDRTLSFWLYHSTDWSASNDTVSAQISTDGGSTWQTLGTYSRVNGTNAWEKIELDLSSYTGQTVRFGFLGVSANGDYIYIDDISLSGATPAAPLLQSAATSTDGTKVILTFNKAMAAPTGESAEFAVIVNDNLDPVIGTALDPSDAKNIVLTLTTPIAYDDDVTVSYPPGGSIESSDGGVLATFTDQAVTNMVADTTAAFAWVVYSNGTGLPEGPAKLSLPDGQLTSILSDSSIWMSGAEFIGNQLYGVSYSGAYSDLYSINAQTGAYVLVANTGVLFTGFTYDTVGQTAYASDPYNLYTVNLETGASAAVGAFADTNPYLVIGIAADNDGNLFGLDIVQGVLLSINPTTAEATVIGSLGVNISYAQDIAYDRDNNILYGTLYNNSTSRGELYSINTSTGQASFICNLGAEIDGFAIPYTGIPHTDTTAPALTAGDVSRTSDALATVKFTSDEAGQYYYAVVAGDDSAPDIDTTGDGTPCDTTEHTISLTELTAGAKDIYIVVKDAAGNVSSSNFKIGIPAYVPTAHGSIQFDTGGWGTYEGYIGYAQVERSDGSDGTVTVDYTTVDGTAVAGTHYAAQSGTLTWADGDSAPKTIPFTINNDNNYNGYLQFSYVLSNPTGGAVLGDYNHLPVTISDNDTPPVPSGLTAAAGSGRVTLNWNEVKDAYYKVYFSTIAGSFNETDSVEVSDGTSTVITGLNNGTKYYFAIKAGHNIYFSDMSNAVSATPSGGGGGGGSYTPPQYPVTDTNQGTQAGGQTKLSKKNAESGDTIIITVTPDKGYESGAPTVLDKGGNPVAVTDNGDGTFSFKMPAGGVSVDTKFTKIDYFDDVNEDDWFDEASWYHALRQV